MTAAVHIDWTGSEAQRVIRDLVSLATIPAGWLGREPARIAESAANLIVHTLRANAACVCVASSLQEKVLGERNSAYPGFADQVHGLLAGNPDSSLPIVETLVCDGWPAPLRVSVQPIGIAGEFGFVAAGCESQVFPSETDSLLLSVMANQLVVAIQTARLLNARQASEAAVRESEERFRAIVGTTPECVKLVARDGALLHMNSAGLALVEADDCASVLGTKVYELIAPEDHDRFRTFNERVCDGERGSLQFEIIGLKGTRRLMETHAAPFRAADGSTVQLAITRDITSQKRAEQALRESEQRFRVITEASPIMVWMSGRDKLCHYFNKGWLEFVGRSLEEEVGNGWAENVHPDDFDRCLQTYVSSFDARQPFVMEYRLRHRTGQYRWIVDHGVPRYSADGTFEGYVGGCLDIHEQKEAAEAKHRLAAIVESSEDAIVSKDLNGIVTSWNRGAEAVFGYKADEMIGRSILTIIPPELQHDEARILQTISRGDSIRHFETVRLTKDGRRIEVSLTISPVRDDAGRVVGAAKIVRDISQRKEMERALLTTERLAAVGRLAATVAHEINNPLEVVTNLVYLAKSVAVRPDVREYLASAEEELDRVAHLTKQTLGFYREVKGVTTVEVGKTVESLLNVFASRASNKNLIIETEIRDEVPIQGAPGEIRQLIANLISNSIDAVPPGGRIRVKVSRRQDQPCAGVRITVSDDGVGIPDDVRAQIFEPFFTTKRDVGTGLGLWVCKSIVQKHNGSIRLRTSTRPGRSGTVISVFLPTAAGSAIESLREAG